MITYRELSLKNRPRFVSDSMTNIKALDMSLAGVNQISLLNGKALSYEIEYYGNYINTYPLYFVFNDVDVYFSCVDGEKYLVFALTDKNKEMLKDYKEFWDKFKEEIKTMKGGVAFEYDKDFMRIRFECNNGLPLNKIMNDPVCVIIARSVFEEKNGKFYPQVFLYSCCLEYDHDDNAYASCKAPLKSVGSSALGEHMLKKRVVNFVTTDFNSL